MNAVNREGYIPLHLAVQAGRVPAVRQLLEMGAQVHAETYTSHIAPIHLAAHRGNVPCIKTLLEYGADINVQESWGQTPLMLAALRGHKEALVFLLQNTACETRELATLKLLLDSGCDPNATRSSDGASLLKLAIEHRFTEGVQLLLQYGARCHPGKLKDSRLSREPLVAMATSKWGMYTMHFPCDLVTSSCRGEPVKASVPYHPFTVYGPPYCVSIVWEGDHLLGHMLIQI